MPIQAPARDQQLIQIVNAALADAFQKSSKWLACKPGCSQCCVGVFAINQLDAIRLRKGLAELEQQDPQRAARIRERVNATVARLSPDFPGDPVTGLLNTDDSDEACKQWDEYANDVALPGARSRNRDLRALRILARSSVALSARPSRQTVIWDIANCALSAPRKKKWSPTRCIPTPIISKKPC